MGLLSVGAGLLGGILQNKSDKKSAKKQFKYDRNAMLLQDTMNRQAERRQFDYNKRTERERFQWLVQGAENAGFNPLTVLGATGGAMGNSPSTMAPSAAVQQAPLSNIGQTLAQAGENFERFYVDPIEKQAQVLSNELLRKQIDQIDRENLRFGAPVLKKTGPAKKMGHISGPEVSATRPYPRVDRTKVRTPFDVTFNIPSDFARRMGLNRGDTMGTGEIAELLGESVEAIAAMQVPEITSRMAEQGIFTDKQETPDETFILEPPITFTPPTFVR